MIQQDGNFSTFILGYCFKIWVAFGRKINVEVRSEIINPNIYWDLAFYLHVLDCRILRI